MLAKVLESHAGAPDGVSVWSTFNNLRGIPEGALALAAIKLERLGYIEKGIAADMNDEYYTFAMAEDGIEYLLENEDLLEKATEGLSTSTAEDYIPF